MFENSLNSFAPESAKQTFRQVSEIFENLRKSSEVFGNIWRSSEVFGNLPKKSENVAKSSRRPSSIFIFLWNPRKISGSCRKVLKITFQHFKFFLKSSEIIGSLRKSTEFFGKNRKMSESFQNDLPTLFENFWKFSEIFGSVRKCSENFGNTRKFLNVIGGLWKFFYTIPISDTCGLKIKFKILICTLHWYYGFCTGIAYFALVLLFNCTALNQSESSNFFHVCYYTHNSKKVVFWIVVLCIAHCCIPRPQRFVFSNKIAPSTLVAWLIHECCCLLVSIYDAIFKNLLYQWCIAVWVCSNAQCTMQQFRRQPFFN